MRRIITLLVVLAIATIVWLRPRAFNRPSTQPANATNQSVSANNPAGTIDGASTPELIPDATAYSLFFKFVARYNRVHGGKALESYMQQRSLQDIDTEALLKIAQEYEDARKPLDQKISALSGLLDQQPQANTQLKKLKRHRELLLENKIALLRDRLGQDRANRIQQYIHDFVKRQTKILPPRSKGPVGH